MNSLFIFRNDLRIFDNTALLQAVQSSGKVFPIFIFNKAQIDKDKNKFFNEKIINFMLNCLTSLEKKIKENQGGINFFYGDNLKVIDLILKQNTTIKKVFVNCDYTPFSIFRDEQIKKICEANGVEFLSFEDRLLNPPHKILKDDKTPYTIFTPYYNKAKNFLVEKPNKKVINNFSNNLVENDFSISLNDFKKKLGFYKDEKNENFKEESFQALKDLEKLSNYKNERDYPSLDGTSKLSKYLKFGVVSPRAVYYKIIDTFTFEKGEPLVRQLYWRDFFTQIGFNFSKVMSGKNFNANYDKVEWVYDEGDENFLKFCKAKTGFPIIDAGINELLTTGYMHNRVRMIVASFLCKDLHIHWTLGEKFFAKHLIDYDPLVNNGSWQWAASTGCDAQPYFRIFNPKLQQEKFDKDCRYIKKWLVDLRDKSNFEIHNFEVSNLEPYPKPIIDHKTEKDRTLKRFEVLKG